MENNRDWLSHEIGTYLKELRKTAGFSQGDAAKALGYSSNQFISNIERGVCTPSPNIIYNILQAYKINNAKVVDKLLEIQMKYLSAELKGKKLKK